MPPLVRLSLFVTLLLLPVPARAQHEHHPPAPDTAWAWTLDSSAFLTANLQERRFRDFHQVESQNWLMGVGARRLGQGTLALYGMLSFEPFTLRELGSSRSFRPAKRLAARR